MTDFITEVIGYLEQIKKYASDADHVGVEEEAGQFLETFRSYEEDRPDSEQLAASFLSLGIFFNELSIGDLAFNQNNISISCLEIALAIYTEAETNYSHECGKVLNSLGVAYSNLDEGDTISNQNTAIGYFESALKYTTEDDDDRWVKVQRNLAVSYRDHCTEDIEENKELALGHFLSALKVCIPENDPVLWVTMNYEVGELYFTRPKGDPEENHDHGLDYFRTALQSLESPVDRAEMLKSLGRMYEDRNEGDSIENKECAIACYHKVLEVFTKDSVHQDGYASTHFCLGELYNTRQVGDRDKNKERALTSFECFLEVSRDDTPFEPFILGAANGLLGELYLRRQVGDTVSNQERGIVCCQAGLDIAIKDGKSAPLWLIGRYTLGELYSDRLKGDPVKNKEYALACYADTQLMKDVHPFSWGVAQVKTGWLLLDKKDDRAYTHIRLGLEALIVEEPDWYAEKAAIYWQSNKHYFHNSIQLLLKKSYYQEALYWLETIKSRRMLIDLDLSSIPHPPMTSGSSFCVASHYWESSRKITSIQATLDLNRHQNLDKTHNETLYELTNLRQSRFTALKVLEMTEPDYASLIQPKIAQFEDLGVLIRDEKTATVSFYGSGSEVHAITVYRKGGELHTKYWKWTDLDHFIDTVQKFHFMASEMEGPEGKSKEDVQVFLDSLDDLTSEFGELFKRLFVWLKDKGINQVYLCPHHFLEAFPIHAAVFKNNGRRVVARELFDFSYLPSLSMGIKMAKAEPVNNNNIHALFYAPDNQQLPAGKEEFTGLAAIYEKRLKIRAGSEATLALWSEDLINNPVKTVFISCHGTTEPGGFYLRLADKDLIHHSQLIGKLNVKGSFVIASACETSTSLAWSKGEDEYYALDSVFLLMGAVGSIGTFYSTPDVSTASITTEMHRELRQGKSHFQAFKHGVSSYLEREKEITSIWVVKKVIGRGKTVIEPMETLEVDSNHPIFWSYLKFSGLFSD